MHRRRIGVLILALAIGGSLAGCGGGQAVTPIPAVDVSADPEVSTSRPIPTARPTATRWPTVEPVLPTQVPTDAVPTTAPIAEGQPAFSVTNATANVRSGPGSQYSQLGTVQKGQQFAITGKSAASDWWQFDFNGQPGWIFGQVVQASGPVANVPVAGGQAAAAQPVQPVQPAARPAQPAAPRPAPQPAAVPPPPALKYAAVGSTPHVNTNNWVTVNCRLAVDLGANAGRAGTFRLTRDGAPVAEDKPFTQELEWVNAAMEEENRYFRSKNCKAEVIPAVDGTYTGYLVENGEIVSDPINFTVSGDNREFILIWKPR